MKTLTVLVSAYVSCEGIKDLAQYISNVTELTITKETSWNTNASSEQELLELIEDLGRLKLLKSLSLIKIGRSSWPSISIIQNRLPHLQKLEILSCGFSFSDEQILSFVGAATNLRGLSFDGTKINCENPEKFYTNALAIVESRPSPIPLTIYGWNETDKPIIMSQMLRILSK